MESRSERGKREHQLAMLKGRLHRREGQLALAIDLIDEALVGVRHAEKMQRCYGCEQTTQDRSIGNLLDSLRAILLGDLDAEV